MYFTLITLLISDPDPEPMPLFCWKGAPKRRLSLLILYCAPESSTPPAKIPPLQIQLVKQRRIFTFTISQWLAKWRRLDRL